jgi:hypothetical protein
MKNPSASSSGLRTILLLALGALALGAFAPTATAQDIAWSAASGTPSVPTDKIPGFFIWHVKDEVYLTTAGNTKKVGHLFAGNITISGGNLSGLVGVKLEKTDKIFQLNSTTIQFSFTTFGGHDSLHFKIKNGSTLSFDLFHDGSAAGSLVYYGSKKKTTGGQNPTVFNLSK